MRKLFALMLVAGLPLLCFSQQVQISGVKKPNFYFDRVSVSPTTRLVASTIYPSNDLAVFETITGKEIQRIKNGEKLLAVFFGNDSFMVRVNRSSVDMINLLDGSTVNSFRHSDELLEASYAAPSKLLALSTGNEVLLIGCDSNKLTLKQSIAAPGATRLSLAPGGNYVAAKIKDEVICWNITSNKLSATIDARDMIAFALGTESIILLNRSPFTYQQFGFDGVAKAEARKMLLIPEPYRTAISPFSGGFSFNTYGKTVLVYPNGYQELVKTNLVNHKSTASWETGNIITWNDTKIEVTDMEGALYSNIMAEQVGNADLFPDKDNARFHIVSDSMITIASNDKVFKKIPLKGKFISTLTYLGNWKVIPLDNKTILLYDQEKQSVIASFSHPSIPIQYTASGNEVLFIDRTDNSIYRYNIADKQKKKVYMQDDLITSIASINDRVFIGDENGNIRELSVQRNGETKVLQTINLFANAITSMKALKKGGLLAASYGRFLYVGNNFQQTAEQKLFVGHSGFISSIETDSNEEIIYTTSNDQHIRLWDMLKGNAITDYELDSVVANHIVDPEEASFFFTGYNVVIGAIADTALIKKWKGLDERIVLQSPNNNSPLKMAINQQGTLLAAVDNNTVKIRDIKRGFLLNEISIGKDPLNGITFSSDGKMLAIAAAEFVYTYDPYTGNIIRKIDVSKVARVGTWSGGAPALFSRSIHDVEAYQNAFVAFNTHGWHEPVVLHKNSGLRLFEFFFNRDDRFDNQIYDFKCTPDGAWFATYGSSYIKIFAAGNTQTLKYVFPRMSPKRYVSGYADHLSFSPDGKFIAWVDVENNRKKIKIIDLSTGSVVKEHAGGLITLGNNGDYYYADTEETVTKANISGSGSEQLEYEWFRYGNIGVNNIVYNGTQNIVAISDVWGNIRVIDGRSGKAISELNRMDQYNYQAALSPDKKTMLFNNKWGLYTVDLNTLKRESLPANNYPFTAAFSADGKTIYFREGDIIASKNLASQAVDTLYRDAVLSGITGLDISSDGKNLFVHLKSEDVIFINIETKKQWFTFNRFGFGTNNGFITKDVVKKQGKDFLKGILITSDTSNSSIGYALLSTDGKFSKELLTPEVSLVRGKAGEFSKFVFEEDAKVFELSPSGRYLAFMKDLEMYIIDNKTRDTIFNRDNSFSGSIKRATFDKEEKNFIIGTDDGFIEVYDLSKRTKVQNTSFSGLNQLTRFKANDMSIEYIQKEGNELLVKGGNSFLSLFDMGKAQQDKMLDMAFIRGSDQVYINNEGYYYASKDALKYVAYKRGNDFLSLDLTDLKYNRPDKLLRAAGSSDTLLIKAFNNAYQKRLRKNRIDSTWQPRFENIPECKLLNTAELPYDIAEPKVKLKLSSIAVKGRLQSLNIWINNVPLFGRNGTLLSSREQLDTIVNVTLSSGVNKIEYAVKNSAGMESSRTPIYIRHTPPVEPIEKIYFIGIGIDRFADKQYNLQYSTKDIRDLAGKMKEKYSNISIDTLFNENVTISNIKSLRMRLLESSVNDKVIVSYSGHGLLSKDYDYYLSTYPVNFTNPSENGLLFDELENLLDGIPARKKLLLVDACHSGEVDKEEGITMDSTAASIGLSKGITIPPSKNKQKVGLMNSFELMQNLFLNVGNSTGTTIISAAAGNQYALERGDLRNGVFTYCLIEAMDQNKEMKVSELKSKVAERVVEITKGLQKPTSRNETMAVDWNIW